MTFHTNSNTPDAMTRSAELHDGLLVATIILFNSFFLTASSMNDAEQVQEQARTLLQGVIDCLKCIEEGKDTFSQEIHNQNCIIHS